METSQPEKPDWRIGLAVTPKMKDHGDYMKIFVVRKVIPATDSKQEMLVVETYGRIYSSKLTVPSDDWMTA
jgi:hypothetical protein